MGLNQQFNRHATARSLENPRFRTRLPACLTDVEGLNFSLTPELIERNMIAVGLDPATVERINIAWPQKHPHSGHHNAATPIAHELREKLQTAFPGKDIVMAHALYETKKLNRSESQNPRETLTLKQVYQVDLALQDKDMPFLHNRAAKGEAFVLCDWTVSQGTTLASLGSFITHNGGNVVGVVARQKTSFMPNWAPPVRGSFDYMYSEGKPLKDYFSDVLARSVQSTHGYTPDECYALFDAALEPHGLAVDRLTRGEIGQLCKISHLPVFLESYLGMNPDTQAKFIARRRAQAPAA